MLKMACLTGWNVGLKLEILHVKTVFVHGAIIFIYGLLHWFRQCISKGLLCWRFYSCSAYQTTAMNFVPPPQNDTHKKSIGSVDNCRAQTLITVQHERGSNGVMVRVETQAAAVPTCCHPPLCSCHPSAIAARRTKAWSAIVGRMAAIGNIAARVLIQTITSIGLRSCCTVTREGIVSAVDILVPAWVFEANVI